MLIDSNGITMNLDIEFTYNKLWKLKLLLRDNCFINNLNIEINWFAEQFQNVPLILYYWNCNFLWTVHILIRAGTAKIVCGSDEIHNKKDVPL